MSTHTFNLYAQSRNEREIAKHAISHDKLLERLMKYLSVESYSKYDNINNTWTMTPGQEKMATMLAAEAWELDAEDSFELSSKKTRKGEKVAKSLKGNSLA
jgi:hypothetical protein